MKTINKMKRSVLGIIALYVLFPLSALAQTPQRKTTDDGYIYFVEDLRLDKNV